MALKHKINAIDGLVTFCQRRADVVMTFRQKFPEIRVAHDTGGVFLYS